MKTNFYKNIRLKIILVFLLSIVCAASGVLVLYSVVSLCADRFSFVKIILRHLQDSRKETPVVAITGIMLFIIFFFLFTRGAIKYLEEINSALKLISKGNFEVKIPIKYNDELGELAENINLMSAKLKTSIDEERNAERTKNELITSVSHDLRTPLTSVLGYLGLISNDNYQDEVKLRYYVDIAYTKCQDLKKLIDELFEFTKVSYGGLKLNLEKINIGELLEQLAEEFVPILDEEGMECRLSLPKEKAFVNADGSLLVRVFENLLINSIRYGKEGKYVDIKLFKEDSEAVINITNYGETIPEVDLPYIFDRFYRAEKSRSHKTGGAGLGLAISKSIVELHKGTIAASNGQEKTTFEVRLKLC